MSPSTTPLRSRIRLFLRKAGIFKDPLAPNRVWVIRSVALHRRVRVDIYLPGLEEDKEYPVVFFNDGQDLRVMRFKATFRRLILDKAIEPIIAIGLHAGDRWENKGEGREGMRVAEIAAESGWVIERLLAGQRVLVHCSAGMNRSGTICCGVLIALEGLGAEAALERVRQHHPWTHPDPYHWLNLRWQAQISNR